MFNVNPELRAKAGFHHGPTYNRASAIVDGEPAATPVIINDRPYTLRVRYPRANRASLEAMSNTMLVNSTGGTATLGSLATVTELPGQTEILRDNLQRDVEVTARLEGIDLGTGVAAVKKAVNDLKLPPSIRVEYGGTYQEQQKSFHDLVVVLLLALVLIFLVLLFEFRSFSAPVAILSSAVLSTSGVFLALLITQNDVQRLVVHGPDHGGRHRREEWHPVAGREPEVPRRWISRQKRPWCRRGGAGFGPSS